MITAREVSYASRLPWLDYSPGLFANGTLATTMERAPLERPEDPMPATALPIINISEELATPHKRDPSSKRARKIRKVYCDEISSVSPLFRDASYFGVEMGVDFACQGLQ